MTSRPSRHDHPAMVLLIALLAGPLLAPGCRPDCPQADDDATTTDDDTSTGDDDTTVDPCADHPGEILCQGTTAIYCATGGTTDHSEVCDGTTAGGDDLTCIEGLGCAVCSPDTLDCAGDDGSGDGTGDDVVQCAADGLSWTHVETCDTAAGDACIDGACLDRCGQAEAQHTNVGCEFLAVDLTNHFWGDPDHQFQIAVVNTDELTTAVVQLAEHDSGSWQQLAAEDVPPLTSHVFDLEGRNINRTGIAHGAAVRVLSDVPVVSYQLNVLQYSGDVSMLLPATQSAVAFLVPHWSAMYPVAAPEPPFTALSIAGLEPDTAVSLSPTANTSAGGVVPACDSGDTLGPLTLDAGDVLQVTPSQADGPLSGTSIQAGAPVVVFSSSSCAWVPNTWTWACDQVQEQIPPLESWGSSYVAARVPPRWGEDLIAIDIVVWQLLAAEEDVHLQFEAAPGVTGLPADGALTLAAGDAALLEVSGSTTADPGDFAVQGDAPFLLTQYMSGSGLAPWPEEHPGDPCMVLSVSHELFLDRYVIWVIEGDLWTTQHLVLTRETGATITVDGEDVDGLAGSTASLVGTVSEVVRVPVSPGVHVLQGSRPFGVTIIAVGDAISACYLGGMGMAGPWDH